MVLPNRRRLLTHGKYLGFLLYISDDEVCEGDGGEVTYGNGVGEVGAVGECEDGGQFGEGGGCVGAGGEGGVVYADVFDNCEETWSVSGFCLMADLALQSC